MAFPYGLGGTTWVALRDVSLNRMFSSGASFWVCSPASRKHAWPEPYSPADCWGGQWSPAGVLQVSAREEEDGTEGTGCMEWGGWRGLPSAGDELLTDGGNWGRTLGRGVRGGDSCCRHVRGEILCVFKRCPFWS